MPNGLNTSRMIRGAFALFMLAAPGAAQAPADTAAVRKAMQTTSTDYEDKRRNQAPHRMQRASYCDETVGRYCVVYDAGSGAATLPSEAPAVKQARAKAIGAFQAGVNVWPNDSTLVAPLIRYLVEDERPSDALGVARAFAEVSADPVWAQLLIGLSLHALGDEEGSESVFARAMPRMLPSERLGMHDAIALLANPERQRYRTLTGQDRARYHERLWRLADPLYLTTGNESLVEHFSRSVYGRILAYAPGGSDGAWGPDVAELTMRFGVPSSRTQNFGEGMGGKRLTEHFAPNQLTYVPPALITRNGLWAFEPGSAWPYDTVRAHSGYAPGTFRRMMVLDHQVSRFPGRSAKLLRADFVIPVDSAVKFPARFEVAMFALDSAYQLVGELRDTIEVNGPQTRGTLSLPLPASTTAYSLEAIDLDSKLAARARYRLPTRTAARPLISDVTIMEAGEDSPPGSRSSDQFKPLGSLVVKQGAAIALYLEVDGLTADASRQSRYRVDLEVLEQSSPGTFSRVVRTLGRALGMGGNDVAPRITWNQQQNVAETIVIALKLGQIQLDPGLKQFRLTVTDLQTNASAMVDRLVLIAR